MSSTEHVLIVSQRNQPTELHFPDGTFAVLEPRGQLTVAAALRRTPQLLALERERAIRVVEVVAGPRAPGLAAAPPAPEADDEGGDDEADDGSGKSRGKAKRTTKK